MLRPPCTRSILVEEMQLAESTGWSRFTGSVGFRLSSQHCGKPPNAILRWPKICSRCPGPCAQRALPSCQTQFQQGDSGKKHIDLALANALHVRPGVYTSCALAVRKRVSRKGNLQLVVLLVSPKKGMAILGSSYSVHCEDRSRLPQNMTNHTDEKSPM